MNPSLKHKSDLRQRLLHRLNFNVLVFVSAIAFVCYLIFHTLVINETSSATEKEVAAGTEYRSANYLPNLTFHDPVLISGTDKEVGAIYLFSDVDSLLDAWIEIKGFYGSSRLEDMDHFTAGYYAAWQPFVVSAPNDTSHIEWQITFKVAGTSIDSAMDKLAATAVDVDGDGSYLKEFVEATHVTSYAMMNGSNLTVTFSNEVCNARSQTDNVANIDTTKYLSMFQMNFKKTATINYRTGAISTYSGEQIRQNSIYFKYFDYSLSPLPVELVKFSGKVNSTGKVDLMWITASEKNNDYFTLERSSDGKKFEKIGMVNGFGTSTITHSYYFSDNTPLNGSNYYRLSQTDFNGASEQFKPIHLLFSGKQKELELISFSPNPVINSLTVNYNSGEGIVELSILNTSWQPVITEYSKAGKGNNTFEFTRLSALEKGTYFLQLSQNNTSTKATKLIKL